MYKSLGFMPGVYGDIVNQKRVLTSYDLIDEALGQAGLRHLLLHRRPLQDLPGLRHAALHRAAWTCSISELYERPFDLRIVDLDTYELSYDKGGDLTKRDLPLQRGDA